MERSDRRANRPCREGLSRVGATGSLPARALADQPPLSPDTAHAGIGSRATAARAQRPAGSHVYHTLLLLSAITLWVLLFCVFAALGGCVQKTETSLHAQCSDSAAPHCCGRPHCQPYAEEPQSSLIFSADPELTPIPADQITRADWPTTDGLTSYGQTTYFREYWYDQQSLGPNYVNYGYRTFTSWRDGLRTGQ